MAKQAVKFIETWTKYTSGDVASFEADFARKLIDGKVAVAHDFAAASADPEPLSDADLASLTEREGALKAFEARLAAQEAELEKRAAALEGQKAEPVADPAASEAGAPPKQGRK